MEGKIDVFIGLEGVVQRLVETDGDDMGEKSILDVGAIGEDTVEVCKWWDVRGEDEGKV